MTNPWLRNLCKGLAQFVMTEIGRRGYIASFDDLAPNQTWVVEVRCVEQARQAVNAGYESVTPVAPWVVADPVGR